MVRRALNQTAPDLARNEAVVGLLSQVAQAAVTQARN